MADAHFTDGKTKAQESQRLAQGTHSQRGRGAKNQDQALLTPIPSIFLPLCSPLAFPPGCTHSYLPISPSSTVSFLLFLFLAPSNTAGDTRPPPRPATAPARGHLVMPEKLLVVILEGRASGQNGSQGCYWRPATPKTAQGRIIRPQMSTGLGEKRAITGS